MTIRITSELRNPTNIVLSRLKSYKRCSDGYTSRCPAHEDQHASLFIKEDRIDGHCILICFAGCERSTVCEYLDLSEKDLYIQEGKPYRPLKRAALSISDLAIAKGLDPEFLVSCGCSDASDGVHISYKNMDGTNYSRYRVRHGIKGNESFWEQNNPAHPIPYGLERLHMLHPTDTIFIVEGESDCWTLWSHGLASIGIPGAQMYNKLSREHVAKFPKDVVIIQEPGNAGEVFAKKIKTKLLGEIGYSGSVRVLSLPWKDPNELQKQLFQEKKLSEFRSTFMKAIAPVDIITTDSINYALLARAFIMDLREGIVPDWPESGFSDDWDLVVAEALAAFEQGAITELECFLRRKARENTTLAELLSIEVIPSSCPPLPKKASISEFDYNKSRSWQLMSLYQEMSREASPEGFDDFHPFCFVWMLSAIAARRLSMKQGDSKLYTNLRFTLCAESSTFKKSTTAKVAVRMIKDRLCLQHLLSPISDVTPERMVANMAGKLIPENYQELSEDQQQTIKRKLAWAAQKSIYWDEFGQLLQNMGNDRSPKAGFRSLLLELEDCQYQGKDTQKHGEQLIEKPYQSILGCGVPSSMRHVAKRGSDFWQDGSGPRSSYLCPPVGEYKNCPLEPGTEVHCPAELLQELMKWHKRLGEPEIEIVPPEKEEGSYKIIQVADLPEHDLKPTAAANLIYFKYRSALKDLCNSQEFVADLRSCYERLTTTMLRMAMLFASLDGHNAVQELHMAFAQGLCEILRENLHRFYDQASGFKNEKADLEGQILKVLRNQATKHNDPELWWMTVREVSQRIWKSSVAEVKKSLEEMAGITVEEKQGRSRKYRIC